MIFGEVLHIRMLFPELHELLSDLVRELKAVGKLMIALVGLVISLIQRCMNVVLLSISSGVDLRGSSHGG
jgi:hypothetical protein